ncbi:hypothetical protein GCM10027275_53870 [Rhabdobacter roseus]|uniref:Glycosidase n=1 Tax=Rhabdobacter roseus TaxID=1655419 RepID=A0A840U1C0_9BACT|nr:alpha-amylase family glycosyl hydrolase [Rhabdobacter roseus]MBB5287383.1 glycosidase [Rhabdobacter roseus]
MSIRGFLGVLFGLVGWGAEAASVRLHQHSAEVWAARQVLSGELSGLSAESVTVHHNQTSFVVNTTNGQAFSFEIQLKYPHNTIWVEVGQGTSAWVSDTLTYTLGYRPAPLVQPLATLEGDRATLQANVLDNPTQVPLKYLWVPDEQNPAESVVLNPAQPQASVTIPTAPGAYEYRLLVIAENDSSWFRARVVREADRLRAIDPDTDAPSWMNEAVMYQITPYNFVANGTFRDITAKLPELQQLGINTIWLQPVTISSYKGQGYDVVDYFGINPDLGTEQDLAELIRQAKALELRVLFDLVLNHTSIQHPYAQDAIAHGQRSHYYTYYQRQNDGKPYANFYNTDAHGFFFYFWNDLVNLNYDHEEVQRWMLEVCKHWVKKYDIDGYRFDAIWGVNARQSTFARRMRTELKSIKPELLLLAEDKGADPQVYALGFDAAYDWTNSRSWVSQWAWEYEYSESESRTVFNHPDLTQRGTLLRQALFQNNAPHRLLRFLENNDLPRFVHSHQVPRTRLAAALLFSVPGIPLLYNGQEVGFRTHPYQTNAVFQRNQPIEAHDPDGLYRYYQRLIQLRQQYPALRDTTLAEVPTTGVGTLLAFHRWRDEENVVVVLNLTSNPTETTLDLASVLPESTSGEPYWLDDVLNDAQFAVSGRNTQVPMPAYGARWLVLRAGGPVTGANQSLTFTVYPNPSAGRVSIRTSSLAFDQVRIVDGAGRTVFREQLKVPTTHTTLQPNLPPSLYVLQVSNGEKVLSKKWVLQN